jgi:CheY-like chemotaxis protein
MHPNHRIIIAEDEQLLSAVLARLILRHYPTATVQTFANGQDALDNYDAHGADLLLVNHEMPGLDGLSLIRKLRARGDSVPTIGMSGDSRHHDAYMAVGANAFLDATSLNDQLALLLGRYLPPRLNAAL